VNEPNDASYRTTTDWGFDLVNRAASQELRNLWAFPTKVRLERLLWLAVMTSQRDLGLDIPDVAIEDYRAALDVPIEDLRAIHDRELIVHHDVKARLEIFNERAGHQLAHLGMTGRDLDDNLELYLTRRSLEHLAADLARRGEESVSADVARLARKVKFRGIVGAVGTGVDQLQLFNGNRQALEELNAQVASHLGFPPYALLRSVGQVYPRSLDSGVAGSLCATLSATRPADPSNRPSPFPVLMRGYANMLAELAGDQWAEGDVSCSSVRRVALPGLFLGASAYVAQL
jgi:adenylosuccinate lyase